MLNGKTSLETLIGVLAESSLMITNDSGPMHIAAALGVPTVAVFGSTDEKVTGPCGRADTHRETSGRMQSVSAARMSNRSSVHEV